MQPTTDSDWLAFPDLPPRFYLRPTVEVAASLIGKVLLRQWQGQLLAGEIVEVEAYLGGIDAASHTFKGETRRNATMFTEGGACYVYLSYGMHFCMNVVTGKQGVGEGVLIRALRPLHGAAQMATFRGLLWDERPSFVTRLARGPGCLTRALQIDLTFDGVVFGKGDLRLVDAGRRVTRAQIVTSGRVGISKAADLPLRFCLKDSPFVSRKS